MLTRFIAGMMIKHTDAMMIFLFYCICIVMMECLIDVLQRFIKIACYLDGAFTLRKIFLELFAEDWVEFYPLIVHHFIEVNGTEYDSIFLVRDG